MAFLLKTTKLIHNVIGLTRKGGLIGRRRKAFFLDSRNIFHSSRSLSRPAPLYNYKDSSEEERETLDRSINFLSKNIHFKQVTHGNVRSAYDGLKEIGEITNPQVMLLLKCCGEANFLCSNSERIQMAEDIWKTVGDFGIKFDINHYNALLSVFLENEHTFSVKEFLGLLQKEGVEPNLVTYRRLLRAYSQQGDLKGANEILEKMKQLKHPLNEEDFNALIQCHCKMGDLETAMGILKVMRERDLSPTAKSYVHILCYYAERGEIDKLNEIIKELPEKDVYLNCSCILEIVYALVKNGHSEHIDPLLQKLQNDFETIIYTNRIIQRLLHDKLDSIAFKIFESVIMNNREADKLNVNARFIVQHFVLYRSPEETLRLYQDLEQRGWIKAGLPFILKEYYLTKNEHDIVNFLEAMKAQKMEVRSHYYWPAIIKASKRGRDEMLQILEAVPKEFLFRCVDTAEKIILPNFQFQDNWKNDFDILQNLGIRKRALFNGLVLHLLESEKCEEAEQIAATQPLNNLLRLTPILAKLLAKQPDKLCSYFVRMIYLFAHNSVSSKFADRAAEQEEHSEETEDTVESAFDGRQAIFNLAVNSLVRKNLSEETFLRILKEMLEKKMGISAKVGARVTSVYNSEKIKDVVNELTNPKLQFEADPEICKKKIGNSTFQFQVDSVFEKLTSDVQNNLEILRQVIKKYRSMGALIFIKRLAVMGYYEESLALLEDIFKTQDFASRFREMFLEIFFALAEAPDLKYMKEAFHLGVKMRLLNETDYASALQHLLNKKDRWEEVTDNYVEFLKTHEATAHYMEFLWKAVAEGSEDSIRKLSTVLKNKIPEPVFKSSLALAFASNGELKQAKKILDSNRGTMQEDVLYPHCYRIYPTAKASTYEDLLALVKNLEFLDRVPLYKLLLRKYADEENVEGAIKLWLAIEEDDISDYTFLEKMREFMNEPTLENLREFCSNVQDLNSFDKYSFRRFMLQNKYLKAYEVAMANKVTVKEVVNLMLALARLGKFTQVMDLVKKYKPKFNIHNIALSFLTAGHRESFVDFIEFFVKEGEYNAVQHAFNIVNIGRLVGDNDRLFQRFKSLALECFDRGGVTKPLNSYFITCLRHSSTVKEAEDIFQTYHKHFSTVPFQQLSKIAALNNEAKVYENLLISPTLKSLFTENLPVIYSRIISESIDREMVDKAQAILAQAVKEGVGNSLESNALKKLEQALKEQGKEFPHPELVQEGS